MKKLIISNLILVCLVLVPSFVLAQSKPFVEAKNLALKYGVVNNNGDHEFIVENEFPNQLKEFGVFYAFLNRFDEGDYIVIGRSRGEQIFYIYYDGVQKLYYSYIHDYAPGEIPIRDYQEYTEEEATKLAENFFSEFSNLLKNEREIYEENHL